MTDPISIWLISAHLNERLVLVTSATPLNGGKWVVADYGLSVGRHVSSGGCERERLHLVSIRVTHERRVAMIIIPRSQTRLAVTDTATRDRRTKEGVHSGAALYLERDVHAIARRSWGAVGRQIEAEHGYPRPVPERVFDLERATKPEFLHHWIIECAGALEIGRAK